MVWHFDSSLLFTLKDVKNVRKCKIIEKIPIYSNSNSSLRLCISINFHSKCLLKKYITSKKHLFHNYK